MANASGKLMEQAGREFGQALVAEGIRPDSKEGKARILAHAQGFALGSFAVVDALCRHGFDIDAIGAALDADVAEDKASDETQAVARA